MVLQREREKRAAERAARKAETAAEEAGRAKRELGEAREEVERVGRDLESERGRCRDLETRLGKIAADHARSMANVSELTQRYG